MESSNPSGLTSRLTREMCDRIVLEYPPQTKEEEAEMCRKYADDRDKLNELLVCHNITFVLAAVKNYRMRTVEADDFFMYGIEGLADAAQNFDPSLGYRFVTFAGAYIKKHVRNIFCDTLVDVKTNKRTTAMFDAPIGDDDMSTLTLGDWLSIHAKSSNWAPPDPAESLNRIRNKAEADELVDWLCSSILPRNLGYNAHKSIRMYLRGYTLTQISKSLKITRQAVHASLEMHVPKIAKAIAFASPDSELYGVLCRHNVMPKKRLCADAVYRFLRENQITIDHNLESEYERQKRLMADFDSAVELKKEVMGRYGAAADFTAIRLVYELHVKGLNIVAISKNLGINASYAMFLRQRGVRLVKEYLSGKMCLPIMNEATEEVKIVDDIGEDGVPVYVDDSSMEWRSAKPEASIGHVSTVNYSAMQIRGQGTFSKRGLVTSFGRYRGGFYSMYNYLLLSGKRGRGARISPRQLNMMMRLDPAYFASNKSSEPNNTDKTDKTS